MIDGIFDPNLPSPFSIAALVPENKTPSEASEAKNEVNQVNVDVNDVKNV